MNIKKLTQDISNKQFEQAEDFVLYLTERLIKGKLCISELKLSIVNNHPFVYFNMGDKTRKFSIHFMKNGRIQIKYNFCMEYSRVKYDTIFEGDLTKRQISKLLYKNCYEESLESFQGYWDIESYQYPNIDTKSSKGKVAHIAKKEILKIFIRDILKKGNIETLFIKRNCYGCLDIHISNKEKQLFYYVNANHIDNILFGKKILNSRDKEPVERVNLSTNIINGNVIQSKVESSIRKTTRKFINENIKKAQ